MMEIQVNEVVCVKVPQEEYKDAIAEECTAVNKRDWRYSRN